MLDTAAAMNEAPKLDLTARVRALLPLLAGLVVVLAVYSRTLDAPFLWDDEALLESPKVARLDWPWNYLSVPFYPLDELQGLFYRPAVTFSLALDRALHGGNATGFHLTNLLLHLTAVTLVYLLARRYGAARPSAAVAATAFGLFPRLTESVAWIAGRTDVLCTVYVLLAWLAYRRGSFRRILVATAFAFLALLAKESGIAIVIAIVLVELWPWPSKAALKRLAPLLGLTVLYLLLRQETLRNSHWGVVPLTPLDRFFSVLETVGRYAFMTLNPWQPRTQIGLLNHLAIGFVAFGAVVAGLGLVALFRTRKRWNTNLFFAAMIALVPLALVVHVMPLPWLVVAADRLMYTPLAALAVLLAPKLDALLAERADSWASSRARRLGAAAVIGVAASFAVVTYRCSAVYLDRVEFWVNAVETTPHENFLPTTDLAAEFTRAGLYAEALALMDSIEGRTDVTGVQIRSNYARASTLATMGRYREAEALVERTAESTGPNLRTARAYLLANFGRLDEARKAARAVLDDYPNLGRASRLLAHLERFDEERKKLADPATPESERAALRARMEMRLGRRAEATAAWLALLSDPAAPAAVADEAMTFLISFASFENLTRAARVYRARDQRSPILMLNLEEREAHAKRLLDARPRIERALGLQFPG